jgi:hypothetical protein
VLDVRFAAGLLALIRGESFIIAGFIGGLKLNIFVEGDNSCA